MKFLAVLLFILLALYGGYRLLFPSYPTYAWHQKMTVEVETPDGIKTGSSVTSVKWVDGSNPNLGWNKYLGGEAVVIHIGEGRYLIALLRSIYNKTDASLMFVSAISKRTGRRAISSKLFAEVVSKRDRASGVIELPDDQYPTLVTFGDISDPSSVQKVDPHKMAKYFGEGVKLKRITLEVTDEPVTKGKVGKFLKWLSGHKGRLRPYSGPSRHLADVPIADLLDKRDFRRKF